MSYLMLAKPCSDNLKEYVNWYVSRKYDGMRAVWVPHCIGKDVSQCPWANPKSPIRQVSGLFSRYGNVIATKWSVEELGDKVIDGELWSSELSLEEILSITKQHVPDPKEWDKLSYQKFYDLNHRFYQQRVCDGPPKNGKSVKWLLRDSSHNDCGGLITGSRVHTVVQQYVDSLSMIESYEREALEQGYEGVMFWNGLYEYKRSNGLRKLKRTIEAQGTVVSVKEGQERLVGMMGSIMLAYTNPKTNCLDYFSISGFDDAERGYDEWEDKVGEVVTFRCKGYTKKGRPREARYLYTGGEYNG